MSFAGYLWFFLDSFYLTRKLPLLIPLTYIQRESPFLSPILHPPSVIVFRIPFLEMLPFVSTALYIFFSPINFVDEHGRRWAFVGAFAMITQYVSNFFEGTYFWYPGNWADPEWNLKFSWLKRKYLALCGSVYCKV